MAALTETEFDNLPSIRAKTYVSELRAIHIHGGLPGRPASVVTEAGQFRLSKALNKLAERAFSTPAKAQQKTKGKLGEILAHMVGGDFDATVAEMSEEEEQEDPLCRLADKLARDALKRLEGLTQSAVAKAYTERRDELVADAIRSLSGGA